MSTPIIPMPPAPPRFTRASEEIGHQVAKFLDELCASASRVARLECAIIAVHVAADWADSHDTTCHDCSRTSSELGEAIRKKIMEAA